MLVACLSDGMHGQVFEAHDAVLGIYSAALHDGMLALAVNNTVQVQRAFAFTWSRDRHYYFPSSSRRYATLFAIMRVCRGQHCTWPEEPICLDLVMERLAPLLWGLA